MKYGLNVPLNSKQVKLLPVRKTTISKDKLNRWVESVDHSGFTPTSIGITGQELKRAQRVSKKTSNRKETPGRRKQVVIEFKRDSTGKILLDEKGNRIFSHLKIIQHKRLHV